MFLKTFKLNYKLNTKLYTFATMSFNPYYILGVDRNTPFDDIKKQYFKLASEFHPDRNKSPDASKQFITIKEAYETIKKQQGKTVKMDFEGSDGRKSRSGFESVRPDSSQYRDDFFKNEHRRSESDYKEWAYKAAQDPETEKFADSFEAIHEIKDIKFRPDDIKIPDASKRFNLDEQRVQMKLFNSNSTLYLFFVLGGLGIIYWFLNNASNKAQRENVEEMLYNMQRVEEDEENLIETADERMQKITKGLKQNKEYKKFVERIEEESKFKRAQRDRLVPQMKKFVSASELEEEV